ncbi:MAG TPA: response regulator transcription factor [Tepidiformaceae bacterium]|nr:response regulator transcription factor [Tepidiformaceae bacterium]
MRSVLLVTRHTDVAALAPALERAALSAEVRAPEQLALDAGSLATDAVLLDLRDIPPAALDLLLTDAAERGVVLMALLPPEQLDRIPVGVDVDDFAVLPVEPPELARRIERALWRRHGIDTENFVRCGALALDLSNYRVTVDGEPLVMTFKEYELLRFLAMNAGRVFTREQLLNRVWGYDYFGGSRTVDVHIRRIRAKIEIRGHAFIETVRNVGYRLVAEARTDAAVDA